MFRNLIPFAGVSFPSERFSACEWYAGRAGTLTHGKHDSQLSIHERKIMKTPKLMIFFIFLALILLALSSISILVVLINKGKLTSLIEQHIRKAGNMDITIGNIHMDLFSGFTLNHISVNDKGHKESFTITCKSCSVAYNLPGLLKGQIRGISLSDVEGYIDTEAIKPGGTSTLPDTGTPSLRISDRIPHYIQIKDIRIENISIKLKSTDRAVIISESKLHIRDFQSSGNPYFSLSGEISLLTPQSAHSATLGGFEMNGCYNLLEDRLILSDPSHAVLNRNALFKVAGDIRSLAATPTVNLMIDAENISIDTISRMLEAYGLKMSTLPALKGNCSTRFSIKGGHDALNIQSTISITDLSLKNESLTFTIKSLEIPFEAKISPSAPKNQLQVEGKCMINEGQLLIDTRQLMSIDVPILYSLQYPHTLAVTSHGMKGNLFIDSTPLPINELISDLQMNLYLDQPDSIKFEAAIQTTFSDPLFLSGTFDKEELVLSDFSMKTDDIDCNAFSRTVTALIPEYYREWKLHGCLSLDTTLISSSENKREGKTMSTTLSLAEGGFASPDYEYFCEKLNGNIQTDITLDSLMNQFSFRTSCSVEPFLVQLGSFTTDMKNRQTQFSFNGDYAPQERNLSNVSGTFLWKDIGTITIDGEVLNLPYEPHIDVELAMKNLSQTSLFETFVKDTIQYSHPSLFHSDIEGEINGQLRFLGLLNALDIDGTINMNKTTLTHRNSSIEGLNLRLPLSFTYPTSADTIQKQDVPDLQYGTMSIKKISQGPLVLEDLRLSPIIISNNFYIKDPLRIPVFGGTLEINDVAMENIINPDRNVRLAFEFQDINLEKITDTYMLTPLEGILNSSLIPLEQKKDRLYSRGEMKIAVFGGEIIIRDLRLSNFLTPLMGIEFSAKINDLNLGKMSTTYKDWGGITGVVNGDIKDFKLVAGEPSSFDIQVKTKKVDNLQQTVSTKFLKKFVPGIGNVLEKFGLTNYKYAVMGLHAKLENDYITLRGAVREGGKDLFMKGAGLKKLEIVFYDANKKIEFKNFMNSFKGMLSSDFEETEVQFK
ncbi:MAG: hypothetical protein MRK01_00725 [Candidatus Scalindua sp.]|nr:hypothetical protein [Candidatus Scalindua sp.]